MAFELDIEDISLLAESLRNRMPLQLRRGWVKHIQIIKIDDYYVPRFMNDYTPNNGERIKHGIGYPLRTYFLPCGKYTSLTT